MSTADSRPFAGTYRLCSFGSPSRSLYSPTKAGQVHVTLLSSKHDEHELYGALQRVLTNPVGGVGVVRQWQGQGKRRGMERVQGEKSKTISGCFLPRHLQRIRGTLRIATNIAYKVLYSLLEHGLEGKSPSCCPCSGLLTPMGMTYSL